jgi:tetratricopeptide (TPR) repeat protein
MNEGPAPEEQMSAPQIEAPASVRLAVFKWTGEEKRHLSTVTLKKAEGVAWTLEATGPPAEELRALLERFTEARWSLAKDAAALPTKTPADALADMLTADGFSVERLPAGDHQINIQIDLKTGKVVGTHAAMHALAASDEGMGRRVFEAIEGGLSKFTDELADEIDKRLAENDVNGAVAAVKRGLDQGLFGLPLSKRLLDALTRIDVSGLSVPDKRHVRDGRLIAAQQLRRFDVAGSEADDILAEDTGTLSAGQIATLRMTAALGALARGHRETALTSLRSLLKEPSHLNAEGRGWAWRNISNILPGDDPEARRAAQYSSDAFLEAGDKTEAGKSLMRLANILLRTDPTEAVKTLDEMIAVLDQEGLNDRHIRGAALHARANRLAKLHRHADAFRDATEAVELQRGLLGAEAEFISSLHLASVEAHFIGDIEKAGVFAAEAAKLTEEFNIPHFQLAQRVSTLANAFDPKAAEDLLRDAEVVKNLEVIAGVRIIQATTDSSLTDMQRLELLEETYTRLKSARGQRPLLHPVSLGIAKQLVAMEELPRAVEWLRDILARDPYDTAASADLVNTLWKMEKWGEAAVFIKHQLDLRGEHPVMLFAYGRSLFESGDFSGSIAALTRSLGLVKSDENLKTQVVKLRDRALDLGGTLLPPPPPKPASGPVTRKEFEAALVSFGHAVSAMRRMAFWGKKKAGRRPWIERPERKAQDLMHMYLQAKFDERVELYEEIVAGAGRIDLYVKLAGGLSIVVEIKMCGGSYSSTYAAAGEHQVTHYMKNKGTKLGYLVVFDGRTRMFGKRVLSGRRGGYTVIEQCVDVRPAVKPRIGNKR